MRYIWDNDLHIHSFLSTCSKDPEQVPERILQYAKENGLKTVVLTDHCWNHNAMLSDKWRLDGEPGHEKWALWYKPQDLAHVSQSRPLPQAEGIRFLFGVETEMHKTGFVGMNPEDYAHLDFINVPLTHFHMSGFTISENDAVSISSRAGAWIRRLDTFLSLDLPFRKMGLAHLTCGLMAPARQGYQRQDYLDLLDLLPGDEMEDLFQRAAALGAGIELNAGDMNFAPEEADTVLRVYRIAKDQGCKFYMGSDAHGVASFRNVNAVFQRAIDLLDLTEDDKFHIESHD